MRKLRLLQMRELQLRQLQLLHLLSEKISQFTKAKLCVSFAFFVHKKTSKRLRMLVFKNKIGTKSIVYRLRQIPSIALAGNRVLRFFFAIF